MVRVLSLTICCIAFSAASSIGREWTDSSGKHRIEATLVEVIDDSVRLKKSDGTFVRLRLDQLSQADRAFLAAEAATVLNEAVQGDKPDVRKSTGAPQSPFGGAKTFKDLEALAKKQSVISAVITLYKTFLHDPQIKKAEKDLARERLTYWEDLETKGAVRVGGKWLTSEQLAELQKEERRLVDEASRLLQTGNLQLAEGKLAAASKANPDGIAAEFLLGLYHSLVKRKAAAAEQHFQECTKRLRRKAAMSNEDRGNLIASLNNLAIVEARQRKQAAALKHWKEASQLAPAPPELIQNVGRFVYLARATPQLGIQKTTEKSAGDLFGSLTARPAERSFEESVGWLYIGYFNSVDTPTENKSTVAGAKPAPNDNPVSAGMPITVGSGSGFIVHPGYIVTNHHVVEDADEIVIHTRTNQLERHKATLIAISPKQDIALLECKELTLPAVAFSLEAPKLASDLVVLGYPMLDVVGTDLKATKGSVSGLPNPDIDNRLLYDATTNPGNSGGPVCDQRGQAVALHRGVYLLSGKLAMGVPAAVVLEFIKRELPAFVQPSASPTVLEWSQVAETVGNSTVLIEIRQVPAKAHAIGSSVPARDKKQASWRTFEDPWCMLCNGSGQADCSNCARGTVLATDTSVVAVNPASGQRFTSSMETEVRCPACGGKGRVACKYCVGGIDPTVKGGAGR